MEQPDRKDLKGQLEQMALLAHKDHRVLREQMVLTVL